MNLFEEVTSHQHACTDAATSSPVSVLVDHVYQTDCIQFMRQLPDASVHLVVSDPPYQFATHNVGTGGIMKDKKHLKKIRDTFGMDYNPVDYLQECYRLCQPFNGYFFCNIKTRGMYQKWAEQKKLVYEEHILYKTNPIPLHHVHFLRDKEFCVYMRRRGACFNGGLPYDYYRTIHKHSIGGVLTKWHECQKPLDMIERLIAVSSRPGEVVFDGYMGSNTVAIAARKLQRHYIGCEFDRERWDTGMVRLGQMELL